MLLRAPLRSRPSHAESVSTDDPSSSVGRTPTQRADGTRRVQRNEVAHGCDGKTGGAQRRSSSGPASAAWQRRFGSRPSVASTRRASSGTVAIAEIVAHAACTKRPRGPTPASCQHPRPSLGPRRPHRRRASARKSSPQPRFVAVSADVRRVYGDLVDRCRRCRYAGVQPRHDLHCLRARRVAPRTHRRTPIDSHQDSVDRCDGSSDTPVVQNMCATSESPLERKRQHRRTTRRSAVDEEVRMDKFGLTKRCRMSHGARGRTGARTRWHYAFQVERPADIAARSMMFSRRHISGKIRSARRRSRRSTTP